MMLSPSTTISALVFGALIATSTTTILAMEEKKEKKQDKGQLCFIVNKKKEIKDYSAFAPMQFYKDPSEFLGKDITTVIPFTSEKTREKVNQRFKIAAKEGKITYVRYEIAGGEGVKYKAKITPLRNGKDNDNSYFVKVQQTGHITNV
jgi:hypothetical protein